MKADIEQFKLLSSEFDDYIRSGNLKPIFTIFQIYRTRVNQRIEFVLNRLRSPFDYSLQETYLLDPDSTKWSESENELNDFWRKRIKNDILNLRLANKKDNEIIDTLDQRYTHIARRTRQFNVDDIFQSFINAYANSIEPHTSYYSPRGAENFKIHMRLSLEGIGAVLQSDNEYTLVRRVIPGGPADVAGELKSDDRIIGVGQENEEVVDVIGWRLDDVVDLIRGPKASVVNLEILPAQNGVDGESEIITIVRDKIKLEEQAAKKEIIEVESQTGLAKLGVIDLPSFYSDFDGKHTNDPDYRSTTKDVRKLLGELSSSDIDGLIIDLRGNGGGSLDEAIDLVGLFIPSGPVVQIQNTRGKVGVREDYDPETVYKGPLAVLVDRHSASASEIFAGAIKDYNRGLIIGEPTFGKGTVQSLYTLQPFSKTNESTGQLKVTVAQFFRVNGESTQHRGVVPDITWHTSIQEEDSGESSFENAIPWKKIGKARFKPVSESIDQEILEQTIDRHLARVTTHPEFEFALAVNQINKSNRERKYVSLNEQQRKLDRIKRDQQRLELENKKRLALGDAVFESVDQLDKAQGLVNDNSDDDQTDPFLLESGKILSDFTFFNLNGLNTKLVDKSNNTNS